MSLNKSDTRRLSLLAGSSIVAASLTAMAGMALPSAALAANECGDPSANGSTADILVCTPGAYPAGIDYSTTSDGNLTVVLRDRVDTGTSNTAGIGGVRMFGDVGESMSLLRQDSPGVAGDPRIINTTGRGVDVSTQGAGAALVNLTDGDPTASESTTAPTGAAPAPLRVTGGTDAIRAEATGTGAVSVILAETGVASGTNHPKAILNAGAVVGSNGSGVVARSTSGAINVDVRGATFTINGTNGGGSVDALSASGNITIATGSAPGRLFGIRAQTGGVGTLALTVIGTVSASGSTGQAGIDTVAGAGSTLITITNGGISGGAGPAIRAISASTSATAVNVQNIGGSISGRVDFSGVTSGGVTFNNAGSTTISGWTPSGTSTFGGGNDTVTLGGAGIYNSAAGTIMNFGAGNDTFNIAGKYSVTTRFAQPPFGTLVVVTGGTTMNFGSGADTMNVSGVLTIDYLTITGLEAFNNSGQMLFGARREGSQYVAVFTGTDGDGDDVLSLPGVVYSGSGSGSIELDVAFGAEQAGCATPTGAGDCLDLRGGSTSGVTQVNANYNGPVPTLGGYEPVGITVVDVGGGTSAAGHFVLGPNSSGYVVDPVLGGAMDRPGLFRYVLAYDATNQRHAIVGLPRAEVMGYAVLSSVAQSIWRLTADTVTDRQTNLRDAEQGGVWLRTAGEYTRREATSDLARFDDTVVIDNGYNLYAGTVMGGIDLLAGEHDQFQYAAGAQIGYVSSSFDMDETESSGRLTGATGGIYGGVWSDWFFVDGTVNLNGLALDYQLPALNSKTTTYLNSIGASVEAGARAMVTDSSFVEPTAALMWVRTSFEEISLSGGEVQPADAESLRAGLGMRVGATLAGESVSASYYATGRAWYELEGENSGVVHSPGAGLPFTDEFTGTFGEAALGFSIFNVANTLSGFGTTGVKFKDGYSAVNLSLGVRLAW